MRLVVGVVTLVVCVHAGLWALLRDQSAAPDVDGPLASVSFSPYHGSAPPSAANRPTASQIRADLKIIAPYTRALRTYSSTCGGELVPSIATELDLRVTVGAWIQRESDKDKEPGCTGVAAGEKRNEREVRAAIDLAKKHHNVNAIVVGNEAIYRHELEPVGDDPVDAEEAARLKEAGNPDELRKAKEDIAVGRLIKIIKRVKRESPVPVTTGEVWNVWRDHPELVSNVDFIAVHVLPYWEGRSGRTAVEDAIGAYNQLRQRYPGKRIVIAEFGWPSAGYNLKEANPGRIEQAEILRNFVSRAEAMGIDYNIVEATDQPWKVDEGSVGPYWGMFDANGRAKFSWTGPVTHPEHGKLAAVAVLLGLLLSLPLVRLGTATAGEAGLLAVCANAVGAWFAAIFGYWNGHYFVLGAAIALGMGGTLLVPLVLIALSRMEEIAAVAFGGRQRRLLAPAAATAAATMPKVSIHVPAYREAPDMLKLTLDALARLDYPNYECVIVINNTPEPEFWQPVEAHCRALGERFKFVFAEKLAGFKAGALRLALAHTADDAAIIGVIDADYVVHPDWLKDLVPAFADPEVGLVQAPQDHRDGGRSVLHHALNGEYAGFFDIGMVERNEANAIIIHGTMCLIRRAALEAAGGWSSDTIVEDTDLGLTILELGWRALYTNRRYGYGLLPDTYESFKKQRHRWAYGGMQIIRKHWRRFLPGASRLTADQKREYSLGWLNWLGAESLGVAVAMLNLMWVPVVAFVGVAIPDKILTVPIIAAFFVSLLHFVMLYRMRVAIPVSQMVGSVFAAMSVQWTVARAVCDGIVKDHLPFARTAKGGLGLRAREFPAFWEAVLGGLLVLGAAILIATNTQQIREINVFAAVLMIQSLPFLAAVALAALETSRANEFAFWTAIAARFAELLPRRTGVARQEPIINNQKSVVSE
jgi:cellulose synthase/poly-beta-1,6-N-acetylglucosamine synthase-like glycosyltransferase/exo-beta-1,3-glucanase (GH17 family)